MTKSDRGSVRAPGTLVRKRANQNGALLDIAPRTIRTLLEYKWPLYGSMLIVVDPEHISSCCSECGAFDPDSRISRDRFVCNDCHKMLDADVNAAKNILAFGISPTGRHQACESSQTIGRKQEEDAREGRSSALQGRE